MKAGKTLANDLRWKRFNIYNRGNKLSGQMRKTAVCLTPQAMYNQFKRPSAASVSELYYICRKT